MDYWHGTVQAPKWLNEQTLMLSAALNPKPQSQPPVMRKVFLICYDVCDAKRLRKVYKTLKGAGDALQYSVFRCELTPEEKQDLLSELWEIINPGQDRLLFANLGPVEGRGFDCLEYWGEPREQPEFTRPIVL